jgi:hypothetical protein
VAGYFLGSNNDNVIALTVEDREPSVLPRALLGVVQSHQSADTTKLLLEAAQDKSDWLVQYYVACGLTDIVRQALLTLPDENVVSASASGCCDRGRNRDATTRCFHGVAPDGRVS